MYHFLLEGMYSYTYLLASFYIIRSIYRFSDYASHYMIEHKWLDISPSKLEKIEECIYSSLHSIICTTMASWSMSKSMIEDPWNPLSVTLHEFPQNNQLQLFTTTFSLTYFMMDLAKCVYHRKYMFILHHLAAIHLLYHGLDSFSQNDSKGFYIMNFLFLLESNTILLNTGYLLKEMGFHYSITCTSWIIHLFIFITFRLIMIPKLILIYYMYEGITLRSLMMLPSFALIWIGSVYWSYRQILGIQKYMKESSHRNS